MPSRPSPDSMLSRLIIVFSLLAVFIGLAGYRYYEFQEKQVKRDIQDELSAIADLQVRQIDAWRTERLNDAAAVSRTGTFAALARQFFANPGSADLKTKTLVFLRSFQNVYGYKSIVLLDNGGVVRMTLPPQEGAIGPLARASLRKVMQDLKPHLTDIHRASVVSYAHFDLVTPLLFNEGKSVIPVGALLYRIDSNQFLNPLIQAWPGSSRSAEILLLRKEQDAVLLLNEVRHRKDLALVLRMALSDKPALSAVIEHGGKRFVEFNDYRDVPVLAAVQQVPDTNWFLVAKVDREEIYAPLRRQAAFLLIVIFALIATAGLCIIFWWRQKNAEHLRKQYESELERRTLSLRYLTLCEYANDIILLIGPTGNIIEANKRAATAYGYTHDELLRLNLSDLRPPETRNEIAAQMRNVKEQHGFVFETMHCRKDGTTFPVEVSSSVIDVDGNSCFQSIVRDITERKQAEAALRERNSFIEAILDNLPIGLAVNTSADGKMIYMNALFEEIYGWPRNILLDVEQFFTRVYPDPVLRKSMKDRILADMASGDPARMRWDNVPITTRTGESRFVAALNIPLYAQGLMISTVLDITARRKAEQAQIESEHRYKRLVETITDYIYTVEVRNGRAAATIHGPGCVTVTGYTPEEFQADPDLWLRMIFEEDRSPVVEQVNRILANAPVAPIEHRILHKDGSLHWVRNTPVLRHDNEGRLIAYDGMVTDITPLKQLENQLRQAQKMEAVGQLAGGVAHDFNNILTAIIGYSNLLLMKLPDREPGRAFVEQILSAAERAAHLTHSLLAFSRKQIIDLRPVSLNDIIKRVEKLLGRVIGEDIEFKTRLEGTDLPVLADSIQIEQVLMNLAANARDAMPDGGMLLIETKPLALGEEFVRTHSYGKPGRYACIAVTDTGAGMDEKTRNRIFEPFFTTKEVGKGTGLGLSMVYGMVKQHNGNITVDSEPGKGTTFKIYLPLIQPHAEEKITKQPAAVGRGTETVLLAEDDDAVRNLTRSVLEDFGYRVIEAVDGEEAVRKFNESGGAVDLLVLDIIMPKKNGKETYQEIRTIQPGIKALFTSGYSADIVHKKGILDTGLDFVLKPITPTELLKKVREVLDRK